MLKLYNKDCMEVLKEMEDNTIDLVITSPPYNLGMDNVKKEWQKYVIHYNGYNDSMPQEEYEKWQIEILNELYRVLKPTGLLYYNHKERHRRGEYFHPINLIEQSKFHPLQTIIWQRSGGLMFNCGRFSNSYESIIVAYKTDEYMWINGEAEKYFDVWQIPQTKNLGVASFPIEIPRRIISAYSNYPHLTVLDCFMGSGTTAVASIEEGCDFIGMEIDKETFDYAYNRTRTYQSKLM